MNQPEDRLFSTLKHKEIQYLVIPKCGCTFVKNLLWRIDFESDHDNPNRVHDSDRQFRRASDNGFGADEIRKNRYAFTVLRNPVDRFLSLYFDKVLGDGHQRFIPLREILTTYYGLDLGAVSIEGHRRNCMIMLDWIELSLKGDAEIPADPHWTPQGYRMEIIQHFDLKILMLHEVANKLKLLLAPLVPDINLLVAGIERNASRKPISRADLVDKTLHDRIASIYHSDMWLTHKAWEYWEKHQPHSSDEVPRISQIVQ